MSRSIIRPSFETKQKLQMIRQNRKDNDGNTKITDI